MSVIGPSLERLVRDDWGLVVSRLVRAVGDLGLAEDCVQDAIEAALATWPRTGVPDHPTAWITLVARRRALDRLRRDARLGRTAQLLAAEVARAEREGPADPVDEGTAVGDEQLELLFACCHPALSMEARVALTLRAVAGLTASEIARAFVVPPATVAQRLVRAKARIRATGIPFRVPDTAELGDRVREVLAVVYLIYNEGHGATRGAALVRGDLCAEALRLARLLDALLPSQPEAAGLRALIALTDARRPGRLDAAGELVPLDRQDRALWDRALVAEGVDALGRATARVPPGEYALQAGIALEHARAPVAEATDWRRIAELYSLLADLSGSAVVQLNRAVAVGMADGAGPGLAIVEALAPRLDGYLPYHAARADLLARAGRRSDADAAYARALRLAGTGPEQRFLAARRAAAAAGLR
jgi:RNA polymerase sigma-70 factor (ECF subfamily)